MPRCFIHPRRKQRGIKKLFRKLSVSVEGTNLTATFKGSGRIYFDPDRKYQLTPAESGLFVIESPARDVLRFDESGGVITGLTVNPGPWPIGAKLRR